MCFSAAASFSAGVVLTGIGVMSLNESKVSKQLPLAGIPLLFGVQQLMEGMLWLSLTNPDLSHFQAPAAISFLVIALVIWPIWLPLSIVNFEKDEKRTRLMKIFIITGMMVAAYFFYCLINFTSTPVIHQHHIRYDNNFPEMLIPFAAAVYIVSTVAPAIFSTNVKVRWIGVILIIFYTLSRMLFQPSLISVWCFFASGIGILAYLIIHEERKKVLLVSGANKY